MSGASISCAGGVPCPPFSIAGKQLGRGDERDVFPAALRLVGETRPRAVLLENVRGLASEKFTAYRRPMIRELGRLGYVVEWRILNACDFGVPQLRPRFVLVAMRDGLMASFRWPEPAERTITVGDSLVDLMGARCWRGAQRWACGANRVAPTIVGGSRNRRSGSGANAGAQAMGGARRRWDRNCQRASSARFPCGWPPTANT